MSRPADIEIPGESTASQGLLSPPPVPPLPPPQTAGPESPASPSVAATPRSVASSAPRSTNSNVRVVKSLSAARIEPRPTKAAELRKMMSAQSMSPQALRPGGKAMSPTDKLLAQRAAAARRAEAVKDVEVAVAPPVEEEPARSHWLAL